MKILAVVVTYYPEKDLLNSNISAFVKDVDKVLIWENTPESEKRNYRYIQHEKVEYCGDGVNSISRALNYAWRYAKENGYNYLLTMDQDSFWENFSSFVKRTVHEKKVPYGVWTPLVNSEKHEELYLLKDSSITSGTMIPIEILNRMCGWNEFFVVDSVDTEFFAHAKSLGINVYSIAGCRIVQQFGSPVVAHFIKNWIELRNDPPERLYNIYRNYVIVMRMYPNMNYLSVGFRKVWLKKIKWILIFEQYRWKKLYAICKGIIDGYKFNVCSI